MSNPPPDKPRKVVRFGDREYAELVDTRLLPGTNEREFKIIPDPYCQFRHDIQETKEEGWDSDRAYYVKKYPVAYCEPVEASPLKVYWELGVNWKGEKCRAYVGDEQKHRDQIHELLGENNRLWAFVRRQKNVIDRMAKGDKTLYLGMISDLSKAKKIVGSIIHKGGRLGGDDDLGDNIV